MLRSIRSVASAVKGAPSKIILAFGGNARQPRQDVLVLPWDEIDRENWTA